jgi:hypothetical protein
MKLIELPDLSHDWLGVRLDRLEIAGSILWRVSIKGRDRAIERELFDHEGVARDWAVAQADARRLPFIDQRDAEAA